LNTKTHNLSLQGIAGVLFGIICILFVVLINAFINQYTSSSGATSVLPISFFEILILISTVLFVLISYFIIVYVNKRRRKKIGLKGWEQHARKIRIIFLIQFILVLFISYVCIQVGMVKLIIPVALLMHGLSCILASPFTNGYSKILGLFFALQSLLAIFFPEVQFLLMGIAFGGFHIIYGIFESKN